MGDVATEVGPALLRPRHQGAAALSRTASPQLTTPDSSSTRHTITEPADTRPSAQTTGLLSHALDDCPVEDLRGSVIFAGLASSGHLISLPDAALPEARAICTTPPDQLPAAGPTTPTAPHRTTEEDNS
ncbi:hypothetical protein [Streptomyces sp. UG1]|uniref:hypothetical protein n=1 Tax=Streptomyces sp. UG1 TaxID=3417652 RepID=UPI003CF3BEE1